MVQMSSRGSFSKMEAFLKKASSGSMLDQLEKFGDTGVRALASATPKDSGGTSNDWYYEIRKERGSYIISWNNRNVNRGVSIAILLQYGHGTGTGGYVEGRDYINPALRPVFDQIASEAWKAVTSA